MSHLLPPGAPGRTGPAVVAAGVAFSYRKRRGGAPFALALDAWRVERGGKVALYGPSGCGKSTLLYLIAGALPIAAGALEVVGHSLERSSDAARRAFRIREVGFVLQSFPLVDYLDALDNVLYPFRLNASLTLDATQRERARRLLDELGLAGKSAARPHELSQGERQRVAIARALVTDPSLLLADEPTAGLDPEQSQRVLDLLFASCDGGRTLLLVSHDPAILERFEERLAVDALRAGAAAARREQGGR
jgi:ABC-type lipoprotein export system ATPase subunit